MRIVRKIIELEEVEHEFFDVGENFDDLSLIRISMIKDVHYNSFDLFVEICGDGDPDEVAPVLEFYIDLDSLVTEEELFKGIAKQKIPSLFEPELLKELIQRKIRVEWNNGNETGKVIDLNDPGQGLLLAMIR